MQLSDITGAKGDPGENGITPTIGENGNWYLGDEDTGKPSRGERGPAGQDGDQGPAGQTGATPNIRIGTVQTLDPGQPATASISGTPENPLLNLGIPKGETGGGESGGGITEETDPTVPAWAKNPTKPSYTATEVGADASGTAVAKVSEHNTAIDAHSDIRLLVQGLTDRLNTLADSDDDTLDQMSEIVSYIKSNKTLIDAITTQKVNVADIIDNLTTNVGNKPLSASQGVKLKGLIDAIVIPEKLPNPGTLKFTGAVTETYDGSADKTIDIPLGGGSGGGGTVSVEVASTTTGEPGTDAQVTNSGTSQDVKLNFVIPKGANGVTGPKGPKGDTGATPNIQIGTVQTLDPGQQATASMTGSPENPLLNLGIPKGGKGDPGEGSEVEPYELPIMSDTQLGGGKAVAKTDEDVPVAVDPSTGQLFVPTYPESTGGSADIPRQEMQNTDTTVTIEPNKLYIFPEMASLTVTLGTPSDTNVANEYHFFFTSGATATTLTLNDVLSDAYSIEANTKYEVSILENVAYIKGVATGAA